MSFNLLDHIRGKDNCVVVWLFNIGTERFWSKQNYTVSDKSQELTVNHCEEMNLLIAKNQDYVILRRKPSQSYIDSVCDFTNCLPNILTPDFEDEELSVSELVLKSNNLLDKLKKLSADRTIYFVPYGVSELEELIAQTCGLRLIGASSEVNCRINNKVFSRKLAKKLGYKTTDGLICNSIEQVQSAYKELKNEYDSVIIKQPCGASGKGLYVVRDDKKLASVLMILKRCARGQDVPQWIVEGWISQKIDLNYQVYVDTNGNAETFSIKQQLTDSTVYIGSVMPPDIPEHIVTQCEKCGQEIGQHLAKEGFNGILGIDAMIDENGELIPIIEINARFTLSTYISFVPNIKQKTVSFYERFKFEKPMNYEIIKNELQRLDISYDAQHGGALVYTSDTIDDSVMNGIGRLFCLIFAKDIETAVQIWNQVKSLLY